MEEDPFQDGLVDRVRAAGGVYRTPSGGTVRFPEEFGFCRGVRLAIARLLRKKAERGDARILLLGDMIHNPVVNRWFAGHGVTICRHGEAPWRSRGGGPAVFVVPAFGLPLEQERELALGLGEGGEIWDCTCPFVRNVWSIARREALAGRAVFVHGNPRHPETRAIWSRIRDCARAAALVADAGQARSLLQALRRGRLAEDFPGGQLHHPALLGRLPWTLVNQTTMLYHETETIAGLLREGCPLGDFVGNGTICDATRRRQLAAERLVDADCPAVLVLGGTDSSNTIQLYRLAKLKREAYFIEDPADLDAREIRHFEPAERAWHRTSGWLPPGRCLGVLAGASCPDSQLGELLRRLSGIL